MLQGSFGAPPARRYTVRAVVAAAGSFEPHSGQFVHPCSTARPQLGQVGFIAVPQYGQKTNPDFTSAEHPGHGRGSGSRRMK